MATDPQDRPAAAANADDAAPPPDLARHTVSELVVGSPHQLADRPEAVETPSIRPLRRERPAPDASQATLTPFAELGGCTSTGAPAAASLPKIESDPLSAVDIEHVYVDNDPREWSLRKKYWVTFIVSIGALTPTLAAS